MPKMDAGVGTKLLNFHSDKGSDMDVASPKSNLKNRHTVLSRSSSQNVTSHKGNKSDLSRRERTRSGSPDKDAVDGEVEAVF